MSSIMIGSRDNSDSKTPTLKQFVERNNGRYPITSNVKIIFLPNDYGSYSFITDHNFRCQLQVGSETAEDLRSQLTDLIKDKATLVIHPLVDKRVSFMLGVDTDSNSEWEELSWGYKLTLLPPTKPQTGKKNSPSGKGTAEAPLEITA